MPANLYTTYNGVPTNVSIKAKEIKGNFVTGPSKTIDSGSPINLLTTYLEDYPFQMIYVQYVITPRRGPNGRTINHMTPGNGIKLDLKKLLGFVFERWPEGCQVGARVLLERIKTLSVSRDTSPDKQVTRNAIHAINQSISDHIDPVRGIKFTIHPKVSSTDSSPPRIQCSLGIDFSNGNVTSCIIKDEILELSSAESMEDVASLTSWARKETREKPAIEEYRKREEEELSKKSKRPSKSKKDSITDMVRKETSIVTCYYYCSYSC